MPLGTQHKEKHMYHATLPVRICYTQPEIDKAVKDGYSETYIHREYPKVIPVGEGREVVVNNPDEEADLKGKE